MFRQCLPFSYLGIAEQELTWHIGVPGRYRPGVYNMFGHRLAVKHRLLGVRLGSNWWSVQHIADLLSEHTIADLLVPLLSVCFPTAESSRLIPR